MGNQRRKLKKFSGFNEEFWKARIEKLETVKDFYNSQIEEAEHGIESASREIESARNSLKECTS